MKKKICRFCFSDDEELRKTREELLADGWIERKHFWMKHGEFGTTILSKKHSVEKKEQKEKKMR